ncbi:TIGR03557 family F420-dependent LLM class oxidoreductase [Halorussus gelatinilyticus]|uniref:TIGR03557 family F420-dependent LLM class oxidoreductase n=1 Tax=Halorussus gelatinilyticus TaxID=2937524 RepID=A0A8U0IIF9_9EURY|nr:TIGR03557 family F420-dependent LLM class oxidoreductase [Halorussus gelatinilyticus]UPW00064.1 TIGR03557 family F420-dependent LLM class oxidoreductase [Halorussus gelatinilyticus]
MVELGYTLSSEEHGPTDLVNHAVRAEELGFDFASISDHFHPWIGQQGHAPFAWSTLGGVAAATDDLDVGVGVTCPTVRIHPAILAQATATIATMFEESGQQFYFGVGTGENLNEHVLGDHWPPHHVRLDMLEEAVEVIRKLWTGEMVSHHGDHYTVENAKLFTLPDENPPVCVSAYGDQTASRAADLGDGFWSVGPQDVVETFEDEGGEGPKFSQLTVCYADDEDEAVETAYKWWPNSVLPGQLATELATPQFFEQACQMVEKEDVREADSIVTDPDPQAHVESIREFIDAGYDHVYVHQVGPEQEKAMEFYDENVLPEFR